MLHNAFAALMVSDDDISPPSSPLPAQPTVARQPKKKIRRKAWKPLDLEEIRLPRSKSKLKYVFIGGEYVLMSDEAESKAKKLGRKDFPRLGDKPVPKSTSKAKMDSAWQNGILPILESSELPDPIIEERERERERLAHLVKQWKACQEVIEIDDEGDDEYDECDECDEGDDMREADRTDFSSSEEEFEQGGVASTEEVPRVDYWGSDDED